MTIESQKTNIKRLEEQLRQAKQLLDQTINSCNHQWSKPTYDPIRTEGFTSPGDPVGTMGVDRRFPCYVPPSETPRWKRTCLTCGYTEYTTSFTEQTTKNPRF